jgi:hypothetical protein
VNGTVNPGTPFVPLIESNCAPKSTIGGEPLPHWRGSIRVFWPSEAETAGTRLVVRPALGARYDRAVKRDRNLQSTAQARPCTPAHPANRTLPGWVPGALVEQGAVSECEHQGHCRDYADPDARNRSL